MLRLDYQHFDLPFQYPFRISKGLKTHQPTLVVFLGLGAQYGLGEATEILYYDNTIDKMVQTLEKHKADIARYAYNGPERFWHYLHHLIPNDPFLISALDVASWDMWSKLQGLSVREMLKLPTASIPASDYTIGISHPDEALAKYNAHPYPIIKLKVNGTDDLPVLNTLLSKTNATLRLDANEGWTLEDFKEMLPQLDAQRIDLIEQPFHRTDIAALEYYKSSTTIPVIADEAIYDVRTLHALLPYYDGVNIKLSKCAGITPAIQMIQQIKAAGKRIMLGSMSESNIGAAALAQLLPIADYADIDGPLLLAQNIGTDVLYEADGQIQLSNAVGIGVDWAPPHA